MKKILTLILLFVGVQTFGQGHRFGPTVVIIDEVENAIKITDPNQSITIPLNYHALQDGLRIIPNSGKVVGCMEYHKDNINIKMFFEYNDTGFKIVYRQPGAWLSDEVVIKDTDEEIAPESAKTISTYIKNLYASVSGK